MYSYVVKTRRFGLILRVAPLENGDTATILALFERLGEGSRRARFLGTKPRLSHAELTQLAVEDASRHAVVAYVDGDPLPAGIVRDGDTAEIAFAVADRHQGRRVGTTLARELLADARAAGIGSVTATIDASNRAALALLRRCTRILSIRAEGGSLAIRAAIR
jgi:ribosomal protein S18 acetylase RimI-like enzyme